MALIKVAFGLPSITARFSRIEVAYSIQKKTIVITVQMSNTSTPMEKTKPDFDAMDALKLWNMKNRLTQIKSLIINRENLKLSKVCPCFFDAQIPLIISIRMMMNITSTRAGVNPIHWPKAPSIILEVMTGAWLPYLKDGKRLRAKPFTP